MAEQQTFEIDAADLEDDDVADVSSIHRVVVDHQEI